MLVKISYQRPFIILISCSQAEAEAGGGADRSANNEKLMVRLHAIYYVHRDTLSSVVYRATLRSQLSRATLRSQVSRTTLIYMVYKARLRSQVSRLH
jgi:hypothetical protein